MEVKCEHSTQTTGFEPEISGTKPSAVTFRQHMGEKVHSGSNVKCLLCIAWGNVTKHTNTHSVFVCFVWISEQTANSSPYNIKWMVFVNETECVYCAVRTGYLSKRDGVCLNTKHSICFPKMFVWLSACVFCVWTSQYVPKTNNILTDSQRKSNKMQQCIKILFHIYMKLNIFRATHRPSSGA